MRQPQVSTPKNRRCLIDDYLTQSRVSISIWELPSPAAPQKHICGLLPAGGCTFDEWDDVISDWYYLSRLAFIIVSLGLYDILNPAAVHAMQ